VREATLQRHAGCVSFEGCQGLDSFQGAVSVIPDSGDEIRTSATDQGVLVIGTINQKWKSLNHSDIRMD
jgi:hypothetical protein